MTNTDDLRNRSLLGVPERNMPEDVPNVPDQIARYAFAAHWAPGRRVVEFCCGPAYGANLMAAAGASHVLGIDVSQDVVAYNQKRYGRDNVEFRCADLTAPLSVSKADLLICFEGIEHVRDVHAFLRNDTGAMRPEGTAIISTPNATSFLGGHSGNPYHVHEYGRQELEALLKEYFHVVEMHFQWIYGDPYDFRWSATGFLRALVPVPLKHRLRSFLGRPKGAAATAEGAPTPTRNFAACYRPIPVSHLAWPGLRFAEPPVWVAVCQAPKGTAVQAS